MKLFPIAFLTVFLLNSCGKETEEKITKNTKQLQDEIELTFSPEYLKEHDEEKASLIIIKDKDYASFCEFYLDADGYPQLKSSDNEEVHLAHYATLHIDLKESQATYIIDDKETGEMDGYFFFLDENLDRDSGPFTGTSGIDKFVLLPQPQSYGIIHVSPRQSIVDGSEMLDAKCMAFELNSSIDTTILDSLMKHHYPGFLGQLPSTTLYSQQAAIHRIGSGRPFTFYGVFSSIFYKSKANHHYLVTIEDDAFGPPNVTRRYRVITVKKNITHFIILHFT